MKSRSDKRSMIILAPFFLMIAVSLFMPLEHRYYHVIENARNIAQFLCCLVLAGWTIKEGHSLHKTSVMRSNAPFAFWLEVWTLLIISMLGAIDLWGSN